MIATDDLPCMQVLTTAPLFMQLQSLERGAVIGAHVDEHDVGGRAIATTVIRGGVSEVSALECAAECRCEPI